MNILPPLKKVTEQYMPKLKRAKIQQVRHKIKKKPILLRAPMIFKQKVTSHREKTK